MARPRVRDLEVNVDGVDERQQVLHGRLLRRGCCGARARHHAPCRSSRTARHARWSVSPAAMHSAPSPSRPTWKTLRRRHSPARSAAHQRHPPPATASLHRQEELAAGLLDHKRLCHRVGAGVCERGPCARLWHPKSSVACQACVRNAYRICRAVYLDSASCSAISHDRRHRQPALMVMKFLRLLLILQPSMVRWPECRKYATHWPCL